MRLCQGGHQPGGTGRCCLCGPAPHGCCTGVEGLSLDVSCLVDIRDHINKELALRFSTDIESDDAFFTDLNGFQVCAQWLPMRVQCLTVREPPPSTDLCPSADPAPQVPAEASTSGQLLPHAHHGLHPGCAEPPDPAHSPGAGCLQPWQR